MNAVNPNSIYQNDSTWQLLNSGKKADNSNNYIKQAGLFQGGHSAGVSDFQSIMESLSDPLKSAAFVSNTIEGHAEFNLKTTFQAQNGDNINFELDIKLNFKIEQAAAAYSKNKKPEINSADEFSPENTAKRISNFAIAFLPAFQSNHSGQNNTDSLTGFFDLAKDAITKGFDQAKSILGGLYGETAEKTKDLVFKLMNEAKNNISGAGKVSTKVD